MPIKLTTAAPDRGAYLIEIDLVDFDDNAIDPITFTWTLTDHLGNIINERLDVNVADPGSTVQILLQGDDLAYSDGYRRVITIYATYNSDLGLGIPIRESAEFVIDDLIAVET